METFGPRVIGLQLVAAATVCRASGGRSVAASSPLIHFFKYACASTNISVASSTSKHTGDDANILKRMQRIRCQRLQTDCFSIYRENFARDAARRIKKGSN